MEGPIVLRKKCKRNYGIDIVQEFREGIDLDSESYKDPFDEKKKIGGYMKWAFLKVSYTFKSLTTA